MSKKILVLDEDITVLESIAAALTSKNFEVITVGRTYNIFKTIDDCRPDLILMDFFLEGITGAELCNQIKNNPATRHIPVIIISAYKKTMESMKSCGCDYFIAKPFIISELLTGLNTLLGGKNESEEAPNYIESMKK